MSWQTQVSQCTHTDTHTHNHTHQKTHTATEFRVNRGKVLNWNHRHPFSLRDKRRKHYEKCWLYAEALAGSRNDHSKLSGGGDGATTSSSVRLLSMAFLFMTHSTKFLFIHQSDLIVGFIINKGKCRWIRSCIIESIFENFSKNHRIIITLVML